MVSQPCGPVGVSWPLCFRQPEIGRRAMKEIGCQAGGLILGSLIDTCSKVHDNARKSGMKEEERCWDRPPLDDMASAAHL